MSDPLPDGPLARVDAFAGEDLALDGATRVPAGPAARLLLRGTTEAAARAGDVFGMLLPTLPRGGGRDGAGRRALWLGPDEWLLVAPGADPAALSAELVRTLGGAESASHALFDVTARQAGFTLSGPKAATILSGGCPLDLDLSAFPVGTATRTLYVKAEILLVRDGVDAFYLETLRSFLPYLLAQIRHAATGAP